MNDEEVLAAQGRLVVALLAVADTFHQAQTGDLASLALVDESERRLDDLEDLVLQRARLRAPDVSDDLLVAQFRPALWSIAKHVEDLKSGRAPEEVYDNLMAVADSLVAEGDPAAEHIEDILRVLTRPLASTRLRGALLVTLTSSYEALVENVAAVTMSILGEESSVDVGADPQVPESTHRQEIRRSKKRGGPVNGSLELLRSRHGVLVTQRVTTREALLRRNVVVHAQGYVDEDYVKAMAGLGEPSQPVGTEMAYPSSYLRAAADAYLEESWAILVAVAEACAPALVPALVAWCSRSLNQMLLDGRNEVAKAISGVLRARPELERGVRGTLSVNHWLACSRLDSGGRWRDDVEAWDTSHLPPHFEVARLLLLDRPEDAVRRAAELIGRGTLAVDDFYGSAVFVPLRGSLVALGGDLP